MIYAELKPIQFYISTSGGFLPMGTYYSGIVT